MNKRCPISPGSSPSIVLAAAMAVGAAVGAANAAVTGVRASIQTTVSEFVDNEPGSTDNAAELFPDTSPILPMEAFAGLGDFSGQQDAVHGGRGLVVFEDPTLSSEPNPAEFGVETSCFSQDERTSYTISSDVIEIRDIVLSADELKVSEAGQENLVNSTFFLDGALMLWTNDPTRDLTGMVVELEIEILKQAEGEAAEVVLEAFITVEGIAAGEIRLSQSSVLSSLIGGPDLLLDAASDQDTALLVERLEGIGRTHLVLVPTQPINYAYFATAGDPFELRAQISCRAANLPGGTGVSAAFGRPFFALAEVIEPALGGVSGAAVQSAVNRAVRAADASEAQSAGGRFCGALGLEVPLLAFLGLVGIRRGSRGGRTPLDVIE